MFRKKEQKKIERKYLPAKFSLVARALVGAYLVYTAYSLTENFASKQGTERMLFIFFMSVFSIVGLGLIIFSLKDIQAGKYVGGTMDIEEEEEENDIK